MGHRTDIDWELIEREYRLGVKTDVQLSADHSVSRSAIVRRAKKEGWNKDLSAQVKLETKAMVSAAVVKEATEKLQESYKRDATAVEVEAISNALMIAEHEKGGTAGRDVMRKIIDRIAEQVDSAPSIDELIELVRMESSEASAAVAKVTCLPSLVDSAKKAIEGMNKAIEIERKARGLDDKEGDGDSVPEKVANAVKKLNGTS